MRPLSRKAVGAARGQLVTQFLGESVLTALMAFGLSLVLSWMALPVFNGLTGKAYGLSTLFDGQILGFLVLSAVLVGLFAGSYPALFLSSFKPAAVLKGTFEKQGGSRLTLRNALVVFQFAMSIALIIATATVYQQMSFVGDMSLGFDKDQVVTIELTDPIPSARFPAYRQALLGLPGVEAASAGLTSPAGIMNQGNIRPQNGTDDDGILVETYMARYDFVETMGMEVLAGRALSRDFPSDTLTAVILNESAVNALGYASPEAAIGELLVFPGAPPNVPPREVIGVVNDFHSTSVHEAVAPMILFYQSFSFYAFVRLDMNLATTTLAEMERIWERVVPGYVFDVRFLDERFGALYASENVLRKMLEYFAGLAIFIACLGLFGLASFAAEKRTKEVGIRKALGATAQGVTFLLIKDMARLVIPAFVLAAPLVWWAMSIWLSGFVYAVDQSVLTFLWAFVAAVSIAVITVSWQAVRAARTNPIESLRCE